MKKRLISTYIIALLVLSNLLMPTSAHAQEIKILSEDKEEELPFYQGLMVGVDVSGLASKAFGSDAFEQQVKKLSNSTLNRD